MKKLIIGLILLNISLLAKENTTIQVSDFMLDYHSLKGSNVCVQGDIISMGDMTTLMDKNNAMTSISLNTNNLTRDLRKKIMQKCTMMSTCSQIVCGVAQDVMYNKGLIVNEIR